jgi:DNA-binding transcriptional ArsR family regulator
MSGLDPKYVEGIAAEISSPRRRQLFRLLAAGTLPIPADHLERVKLRVHIYHLRRILDGFGLAIVTLGHPLKGYRLEPRKRPY